MSERTSILQDLQKGYPHIAEVVAFLDARGIELPRQGDVLYVESIWKTFWAVVNATDWAGALGVYKESDTTLRVRGGWYNLDGTPTLYEQAAAFDPADNDTTLVWMDDANTVGHGIDGDGWPVGAHIPLAEVDVDADGVITAIRDLRGQTFLNASVS